MNIRMKPSAKTLLAALTLAGLILSAPVDAASPAARHSVYDMDAAERDAYAPAVKTLLHQDTAAALHGLPCGGYYAIPEEAPAAKASIEDSSSRPAWVWAGAGGAVVAAGVAAWIFLSGDEPRDQTVHAVLE